MSATGAGKKDNGVTVESNKSTCKKTRRKSKTLPMYNVILHNDDVNSFEYVVDRVFHIVKELKVPDAAQKVKEAHLENLSILTVTHKERAEFLSDQFASCIPAIKVTIEPV